MADVSSLKVDMHSHLIPGIDDGVNNTDDAVMILKRMQELGYEKVITTPHIMADVYLNNPDVIFNGLQELRIALQKADVDIVVEAAAEYCLDDGFRKHLENNNLLALKDKYLLVELPYFSVPPDFYENLFELQINKYKVVLAHPERYAFWYDNFSKLEDLKIRDVFFQINMISLTGFYSQAVKKVTEKLIDLDMVDFAGSDIHNLPYLEWFDKSLYMPYLEKLLDSGKLKNHLLL